MNKYKNYFWILLTSLAYLFFSLTNPISDSSNKLHLTNLQIRLLQLTFVIPFAASWVAGVIGITNLLSYAKNLKADDEKNAFVNIARGIHILVLSSVLTAFLGIIRTRFGDQNPDIIPTITIMSNYLYIFPTLLGLWLIYLAAGSLARSVRAPDISKVKLVLGLLFPVIITIINIYLTLTNPSRQFASGQTATASYYLPDALIIITILIPSSVTWFVGTLALLNAQNYREYAKGTVYQSALSLLIWGLLSVVMTSMFLQLLLGLGSERLLAYGLSGILAIIYIFCFASDRQIQNI